MLLAYFTHKKKLAKTTHEFVVVGDLLHGARESLDDYALGVHVFGDRALHHLDSHIL